MRGLPACLFVLSAAYGAAHAGVVEADPATYMAAIGRLKPGDTLRLAPGRYVHGLRLHGMQGQAAAPIEIEGPTQGKAVFFAVPRRNTISLANVAYLVIRNLELQGRHFDADGVKCEGSAKFAHHIVLENLSIFNHNGDQSTVGISTKCPAWNWTLRDNTIVHAGTGIYLGNSDGSAPFVAGQITGNRIYHSIGYAMQIKHQRARPALPGMPQSPQVTYIAQNVFAKAENSARGTWARPNVLLGTFPPTGPGSKDLYMVEDNLFDYNPSESLLQAEGRFTLRRNRFFNPKGDAVTIQPHNGRVQQAVVESNTIVAAGTALRIASTVAQQHVTVRHNWLYGGLEFEWFDPDVNMWSPYSPDVLARIRHAAVGVNR